MKSNSNYIDRLINQIVTERGISKFNVDTQLFDFSRLSLVQSRSLGSDIFILTKIIFAEPSVYGSFTTTGPSPITILPQFYIEGNNNILSGSQFLLSNLDYHVNQVFEGQLIVTAKYGQLESVNNLPNSPFYLEFIRINPLVY